MNNNLYQTFYIIGINNDIAIQSDFLDQKPYIFQTIPSIISKFPPTKQPYAFINDNLVIMHCFPQGCNFLIDIPPKEQFFTFQLDNIPFTSSKNRKFGKIYFNCLLFYEPLFQYYKIKQQITNYSCKIENESLLKNIFVPKVICLTSLLPFPKETEIILTTLLQTYGYNEHNNKINTNNKPIPPIEKEIENIIFGIPYIPNNGQNICYTLLDTIIQYKRSPINELPYISYNLTPMLNRTNINHIMKIYKCLLLEIPLLFFSSNISTLTSFIEGIVSLLYPFEYQFPFISVLPSNLYTIIENANCFCLGVNETYKESFFDDNGLEIDDKQIIIVNLDESPISLQPITKYEVRDQIKCLILNDEINQFNWEDEMKFRNNLFFQTNLPSHYKNKIIDNIKEYTRNVNKKKQNNNDEIKEDNVYVREKFFNFIISILKEYSKYIEITDEKLSSFDIEYLNTKSNTIDITAIFNVQNFINKITSKDVEFYKRFLETELFKTFIVKKIYPQHVLDKLQLLFFDEKICAKNARSILTIKKKKTPLLDNQKLLTKDKDYFIQRCSTFNPDQIIFIHQDKSIITKALTYYQQISLEHKTNQNEFISYLLFPKLIYDDVFFNKPYSDIKLLSYEFKPIDYDSQLTNLFEDIIKDKKYYELYSDDINYNLDLFNKSNYHKIEMKCFIEMIWLLVLSGCLWYCDNKERELRINNAFAVLESINRYILEDILELFYCVIVKYSNDVNIIRMYELLLSVRNLNKFNYINFALLCMKMTDDFITNKPNTNQIGRENVNEFIKKKTVKVTLLMRETENILYHYEQTNNINKRSFFNMNECEYYNENNVIEDIKFDNVHKCEQCKNEFEIAYEKILKMENNLNTLEFQCNKCQMKINNTNLKIKTQLKRKIKIEDEDNKTEQYVYYDDICEIKECELLTPQKLLECSWKLILNGNDLNINVDNLQKNEEELFYNFIFYFSLANLPFDFIVPYLKRNHNCKYNNNINIVEQTKECAFEVINENEKE